MFQFFWSLGAFLVALGILIAVHEYGHFWVARRCGVKVERFSIGFGKVLLRRIGKDGTEYSLSAIPLGGYVKMLDSRVEEVPDHLKAQAFDAKTVWQRIAIVAAGPLANFAFAIFAFYVMFLMGVPTVRPVVGEVAPSTIAAEAAISPKSIITRVGQRETVDWEAVNLAMVEYIGNEQMTLTLEEDGRPRTVNLNISDWKVQPDKEPLFVSLGVMPWRPQVSNVLGLVTEEGAAYEAGIRVGDKLMAVNGEPYHDWELLVAEVEAHPGKAMSFTIQRDFNSMTLTVVPDEVTSEEGRLVGKVGISPTMEPWPKEYQVDLSYGLLSAVGPSLDRTWQLVELTLKTIGKLFTGDLAVSNLSGPISIAQGAGSTAGFGLVYFLGFLALISVNLGIINLLPLPVLDGGHLLYFAVELVTGKPVPERIQDVGYRIGSALVLMLMIIAIVNDVARL